MDFKYTPTKVIPISYKISFLDKKIWVFKDFLSVPLGKQPSDWFKMGYEYGVAAAWHGSGSTQHDDSLISLDTSAMRQLW